MFHGSLVALVTPMTLTHDIDYVALADLIDWHIENRTAAIGVAGTTGEASLLSDAETAELIRFTVNHVANRVPVIAGTAANATSKAISNTKMAMELGADACLIMTPAYIKPTQEGLYQHYHAIATAVPIPIILYNVPSRTTSDLLPETVARLALVSNIVAIKEATGDLQRLLSILNLCDAKLDVLSGDDATALEWLQHGAKGVISVTANVAPGHMAMLCNAALQSDDATAQNINKTLDALHHKLFVEGNPIPAKWALHQLGKIQPAIRPPLTWLSECYHPDIQAALAHLRTNPVPA